MTITAENMKFGYKLSYGEVRNIQKRLKDYQEIDFIDYYASLHNEVMNHRIYKTEIKHKEQFETLNIVAKLIGTKRANALINRMLKVAEKNAKPNFDETRIM